jgi:hypothetical protein
VVVGEMTRIFILEDDPMRIMAFREACIGKDLTVCMDVHAAKAEWNPPYDVICLDHDLGGEVMVNSEEENTGFQFVRFLTEPQPFQALMKSAFFVHSYNPEGAHAMCQQLLKSGYVVYRTPFGPTILKQLKGLP